MRRLWKMSYNETRCHIGQHFKVWNRRLIIHDLRRVVATKNHIRKLRFFFNVLCCFIISTGKILSVKKPSHPSQHFRAASWMCFSLSNLVPGRVFRDKPLHPTQGPALGQKSRTRHWQFQDLGRKKPPGFFGRFG